MAWDSTRRILRKRHRVSRRWVIARRAAHAADRQVYPRLPGYFVDRYAFRELPFCLGPRQAPQLFKPPVSDRGMYLTSVVRPARRLGNWTPTPDSPTGLSGFYGTLREQWAAFGARIRLPREVAALPDARSLTWRQVLDDTVFYPGPPVFRGATFIDALDEASAAAILASAGAGGIIDFFCFMLQVHETVHRYQTGEPMLNEVVQAALWSRFLTDEALWDFQRGKNGSLIRESTVVGRHPELPDAAVDAHLDTARMMQSISAENAYFACCLLANRFDRGIVRYSEYLDQLDHLLTLRHNHDAVRGLIVSLL